jgi:cell division protein FtsL
VDHKPDFGSTTAVIAYVRKRVTPTILWSAIGALVTCLVVSITWLVTTQTDIRTAQRDIRQLHDTVGELQKQGDLLHKIDTQLAVMNSKMDDIATEVDRQREWRERITEVAESPPHAARKRR